MLRSGPTERILTVDVKPGWKKGTKIKFAGEGDELSDGSMQDIEFVLEEKPHPVFKRQGDELHTGLSVSVAEALCGFVKPIVHLDGRQVLVRGGEGDAVTAEGAKLFVRGEGMPSSKTGRKGDLVVTVKVVWPDRLDRDKKEAIRRLLL